MKRTSSQRSGARVALLVGLVGLFFGMAPIRAQDIGNFDSESGRADVLKRLAGKSSVESQLTTQMTYEGVIDRTEYLVGPGDKLMLQVWSPAYEEVPVLVTGDGRVAVPYAGPVDVSGKSLADAESLIQAEFDLALRKGRVTVSLLEPRKFRVHVTGQVLAPGTYTLSATQRVSDALDRAGGALSQVAYHGSDSVYVPQASLRRIELRAVSGSVTAVDLLRFYQGGDLSGNPHVTDGAVIYVPTRSAGPEIGIFGEVRLPGVYDYGTGDVIGSLISLAGGLTDLADSAQVTLQTASGGSSHVDLSPSGLAMPVHAGDRVYVGGKPVSQSFGSVTVSGQVARPGGYSIKPGVTTVRELLDLAGGVLPDAAARSARLIRSQDDPVGSERQRVSTKPLRSMSKEEPTMLADIELSAEFSRWLYGTVVLDLTAKEGESGWSGEVRLEDGDRLEIPSQPLGVRVLGYVNNAGEVPWVEGRDLNYYLKQADGTNRAGWKGRAVIIKARNGSQLRYSGRVGIDPGDVLFIPQRPRTTAWERVKDVIQVAAQVATIALIIDTSTK
ncbi:MAG: SLBB domain-containing protein [bacterium]|nr:SLBB domain-containing protein [bacterium]